MTEEDGDNGNGENENVVSLDERRKEDKQRLEIEALASELARQTELAVAKTDISFFSSDYLINGFLFLVANAKDNALIKDRLNRTKKAISKHPNENVRFIFEGAIKERRLQLESEKQRRIAEIRANQRIIGFEEYEQDKYASYDHNSGLPINDVINAQLALKHLGVKAKYNLFKDEPSCVLDGNDLNVNLLFNMIYEKTRVQFSIEKLEVAISTYAMRGAYHPVKNYFDSIEHLEPKGIIENWMTTVFGAEDNELNREIGKKMLVAMVARVYEPGTKFDQMIIFEGSQGTGKSTALEMLVGTEFFNAGRLFDEDKTTAQVEALQGIMLYESADLAGHRKADVDKVKAFLSKTNDRVRLAYARGTKDFRRTAIICGTTNSTMYLMDETGNRRFWPVKCSVVPTANIINDKIYVDTDFIRENRDQLWSEALHLYRNHYSLELDSTLWKQVAELQVERLVEVPGVERIPDIFGLNESEGLYISDDPKFNMFELRIFTRDIILNLFSGIHGHASVGKMVRTAMLTYSHLEHGLKWESGILRIKKLAPANGYRMVTKTKEQYEYLKALVSAYRDERRGSGIDGPSFTM